MDEPKILRNSRFLPYVFVCLFVGAFVLIFMPPHTITERARKNTCICNLRLIDGAKQDWALSNYKTNTDIPTWVDLKPYLGGDLPKCPSGGSYTLERVEAKPTCTIPGHTLP